MTLYDFLASLTNGRFDGLFSRIYGNSEKELLRQRARYLDLAEKFSSHFPEHDDIHVYSLPMNEVICGRNAEKYNGSSFSIALSADICAIVGFQKEDTIRVCMNGCEMKTVNAPNLSGHRGFDAYILTDAMKDITFEEALKMLCNAIEKKPTGGCVLTDYKNADAPEVHIVECTPLTGYSLCVIDTGADVEEESYEVGNVLNTLGIKTLRESDENIVYLRNKLNGSCSDEEIFRAIRLYNESGFAESEYEALKYGIASEFFAIVGNTSSTVNYIVETGVTVCRSYLNGSGNGAVRADGRMIQTIVPSYKAEDFKHMTEKVFGEGCCRVSAIRSEGAVEII